jgi:Zn-dependent protease with chaperone function
MLEHKPTAMPNLVIEGQRLDPASCIEPGTGSAAFFASIPAVFGALVITLITYGIALIVFLLSPLWLWFAQRKAHALIKGSGVLIGEDQLPEIHRCVLSFSERLGLAEPPEVYLVEANVINAAAVRFGKRQTILLTDDVIDACLRSHHPQALAFVLGHELGHIALNHNGAFRGTLSKASKRLARLDEYTCDTVATRLVGDRNIAFAGMMALVTGPQVLPHVNVEALVRQAKEVAKDSYCTKAEKSQSHPLLLNRIKRIMDQREVK